MSLFKSRRPAAPVECVACGSPTDPSSVGLTVMCPACVASVKETVARESRPYRSSEYGGGERRG